LSGNASMTHRAKLKWHCQRGMRELDLLLEWFLVNRYEALSALDQAGFERLLDCPNEDLLAWLIRGDSPQDKQLAGIVSQIRDRPHLYARRCRKNGRKWFASICN